MNIAKVKYRNLPARFWISVLASATDGEEKYDRCPIHILVFMLYVTTLLPSTARCPSPRFLDRCESREFREILTLKILISSRSGV